MLLRCATGEVSDMAPFVLLLQTAGIGLTYFVRTEADGHLSKARLSAAPVVWGRPMLLRCGTGEVSR
jgi:hypothetical protein